MNSSEVRKKYMMTLCTDKKLERWWSMDLCMHLRRVCSH